MDTTAEPLILQIKRAVENAVGIPVRVVQKPNNIFELALLDSLATQPNTAED